MQASFYLRGIGDGRSGDRAMAEHRRSRDLAKADLSAQFC